MGQMFIQGLGQSDIVAPQPIPEIPGQAYGNLQQFWISIRDRCEDVFTPAQCNALLDSRPTILEPRWSRVFD